MNNRRQAFIVLLIPLLFIIVMLLWFPFRFIFEFNTDEGVNLIKAMMTLKGFDLYSQVWSDQPPVLTFMLAGLFQLVGLKVNAGRLVILLMSAATIGAAADYLTRRWGILHTLFGFLALVTLPFYTTLSVSIMIGLPAIAFAMLSFACLDRWHERSQPAYLVVSGIFLALSIFTKLWTAILGPIFLVGVLLQGWRRGEAESRLIAALHPLLWWALGFLPVALIVAIFMVGPANLAQLVSVHLQARTTPEMQLIDETRSINSFLLDSIPLFLLALAGSLIVIFKRAWHALYLILWTLAGYGFLAWVVVPAWFHHQLLVTIPAALLAAIALGTAVSDLTARARSSELWRLKTLPALIVVAVGVYFVVDRIPPTADNFRLDLPNFRSPDLSKDVDFEIVALIGDYADHTNYLFTDRPMYAFRSGVAMPPELAVITQKRYSTGDPTQEQIYTILLETKPEQIIIHRFEYPAVREYMETRNFVRVDNSPRTRHYVMRAIIDAP